MKRVLLLLAFMLFVGIRPALADIHVLACEPTWASLTQELGGDRVDVNSATNPFQDVHYIQAKPSLLAKARNADLLVCSGAQLEIGWLPVLLRQSGNSTIQPGQPGYFEAANYVPMLEVPAQVDRSAGDIHPYGNPHIQTDPHNIAAVAKALADRLAQVDPDGKAYYARRYADFSRRWTAAMARWEQAAAPLKGLRIVPHHKAWIYMIHWLGLVEAGHLEPKPGVPPSAADLARLMAAMKREPADVIIRAVYQSERPSEWLSEHTGIPAVVIPHAPDAVDGADNLFSMFDVMIQRLLDAAQTGQGGAQ